MKKLLMLLLVASLGLADLPAQAADRLSGFLSLANDDVVALEQVKGSTDRHVMIYFGDYQH